MSIDLVPSAVQEELITEAHRLVASEVELAPGPDLRTNLCSMDVGKLWKKLGGQGWFSIAVPEDRGGSGLGVVDEALVLREAGRGLLPGPLIGSLLAARLAVTERPELAQAFMTGELRAAIAYPSSRDDEPPRLRLLWPVRSDHVVLVDETGSMLFDADAFGGLAPVDSVDPTIPIAEATMPAVQPTARAEGRRTTSTTLIHIAALLAGIAEAARDASVGYACEREQFGSPIGRFQAVKHRCADMAVRAEAAWDLTCLAAVAVDRDAGPARGLASAAKVVAADAALDNAADNIQNHGANGYTMENPAHLFLARAHVLDQLLGDRIRHLMTVLDHGPLEFEREDLATP